MAFEPEVLSDREKAVLRCLAQGHDAKSTARELGLSVHAVNERLRTTRRKLGVSSSRQAARLLVSSELRPGYNSVVDKKIGSAISQRSGEHGSQDSTGDKRTYALAVGGICTVLLVIMIAIVASSSAQNGGSGPLPNWSLQSALPKQPSRNFNRVHLSRNRVMWNGEEVSEADIRTFLGVEKQMSPQPLTIFSYSSQVAPGRIKGARQLIDDVLRCQSATCLEVTTPVDEAGTAPEGSEANSTR